ncbi:response regulator transcription factor [Ideonella azotifigens]|uniref:LytTR family DNA-binding domain-containing protein n=1 Tax=Ideonella azotifigens TaxID=513160 RepID=A0ABN1K7C4_9BURK|nr:response regulator transcription factor [Ideonella azotifigens]MCD2342271.1 response regulator transcription factor [Ideonella azotifigens]
MTDRRPTALIADDEPLLRDELALMLAQVWPELLVVAQARNGREALAGVEALQPDICFLDVQMPGISGLEAARQIGRRAHLVFVTAFDHYALKAFEHGVLDYLVKPVEAARLAETVARLKERLRMVEVPGPGIEVMLRQLAGLLQRREQTAGIGAAPLRWLRAGVGQSLRLIPVEQIDFLRADEKYTLVAWRSETGQPAEALLRTPLKELLPQLDTACFAQVHRSVVVNLSAISHVTRGLHETADIHLKDRSEVLPVSRSFLHLFRQM